MATVVESIKIGGVEYRFEEVVRLIDQDRDGKLSAYNGQIDYSSATIMVTEAD